MSCIFIGIRPDEMEHEDATIFMGRVKGMPRFVPEYTIEDFDFTDHCDEFMKRDLAETICAHFGIPEKAGDLFAVISGDRDDREATLEEKGITMDVLPYITGRVHHGPSCITNPSFLHDFIMRLATRMGYSIVSNDINDMSDNSIICFDSEEEVIRLAESMGMTEDQLVNMFDTGACADR